MEWKNRTALVTGGGSGIGREIALGLARRGASVVLAGRTESKIESVAREIRAMGGTSLPVRTDVGNEESVQALAGTVAKEFGGIDFLVNNAAEFAWGPVVTLKTEDWDRVLRTNLTGSFLVTRAFLPGMLERKSGSIVFVASTSGKRADPGGSIYGASKAGLMGFARALLYEVRKENVRVIVISPSMIDTGREIPDPAWVEKAKPHASDVAEAVIGALALPPRALVREIEIWGTNP